MERYALKPDANKARAERVERNTRIVRALFETEQPGPAAMLSAALHQYAEILHEEATWWADSGRKGRQTTSLALHNAAGYAADLAISLTSEGVTYPDVTAELQAIAKLSDASTVVGDTSIIVGGIVAGVAARASLDELQAIAERYPLDEKLAAGLKDGSMTIDLSPVGEVTERQGFVATIPKEHVEMIRIGGVPQAPPENDQIDTPAEPAATSKAIGGVAPVAGQSGIKPLDWSALFIPVDASKRPDHRSPSQITSYENCPLSYRIKRYEGVPELPSWASVGGTAFHRAVQEFEAEAWANEGNRKLNLSLSQVVEDWLGRVETVWESHLNDSLASTMGAHPDIDMRLWYAADGGKENYTWWLVNGGDMFKAYLKQREEWGKQWLLASIPASAADHDAGLAPAIEVPFRYNSGGVDIEGFIDLVWRKRNSGGTSVEYLIEDLKTGRNRQDDPLQLIIYSDAFFGMTRTQGHIEAVFYHARHAERHMRADYLASEPLAELGYRVKAMDASERAGHYPARRSAMCKPCSVAASCPVGKLAA